MNARPPGHQRPRVSRRLARLRERRPEIIRLCTWQRLERGDGEPSPLGVAFARSQVEVIAEAQQAGKLPARFAPGFLLGLVLHIATGWAVVGPEYKLTSAGPLDSDPGTGRILAEPATEPGAGGDRWT